MSDRNKERPAYQELSLVAYWEVFKEAPEIRKSIKWLSGTPEALIGRIWSFNNTNDLLEHLMANRGDLPEQIRDVRLLQKDLGGMQLPGLERARADYYSDPKIREVISGVLSDVKETHPSWAKVNPDYPSKASPAIGSFLEGFAEYLQSLRPGVLGLSRHYILAFEEVLVTYFSDSPLLPDVIGWMVEEIDGFPTETQNRIRKFINENKRDVNGVEAGNKEV